MGFRYVYCWSGVNAEQIEDATGMVPALDVASGPRVVVEFEAALSNAQRAALDELFAEQNMTLAHVEEIPAENVRPAVEETTDDEEDPSERTRPIG